MSLINNKFLSLTNRLQLQAQAKILQQEQQEEKKLEQQKQSETSLRSDESSTQTRAQSSSISDDLLLTYRGININHIETAQQKTVVTMDTLMPMLSNPQPVNIAPLEVKKEPKPATVSNSVINSSSIASQYNSGVVREGHRGLKTPSKLEAITDMARGDLNAVADAIKSELKAQMGSDYNEKEVQRAIDAAIEQTLKVFSDNEERRRTEAGVNDNAFIFKKKGGLFGIIGTYTYNVQALTNTFLSSYNEIATELFNDSQQEKAPGAIGKGVVVGSGVYTSYKENEKKTSTSMIKFKAMNDVKEMARADMSALTDTIREQLKGELGSGYNDSLVRASINEAIERTINQFAQNEGRGVENGFEYKRKSFFRSTCSYNVGNLIDSFIVNFNEINVAKFAALSKEEVNKTKDSITEKKEEIKFLYETTSNFMMLNSNFDKAFANALDSINAGNYNNAEEIVKESLNNSLLNFNCASSEELQTKLDDFFSASSQNYHEMYCGSISNSDFAQIFDKAKNEILQQVSSEKSCDIKEVSNSFDAAVIKQINIYVSSTDSAKAESVQTRSAAPARAASKTGPINVKGSNGYNISYTPNNEDKSCTGTITIKGQDGTSYTIKVNDTNGEELAIEKLVNMLKDIKPELMQDLVKEVDTFDIVNLLPGTNPGSSALAGADSLNGKIYFVYDPMGWYHNGEQTAANPFQQTVLAHEVGHMLDALDYSNKIQSTDNIESFWKLLELLPKKGSGHYDKNFKDMYYGLSNINEFFAEYYAYKMCGDTDNKFKELYDELKSCKKINEKKDKNGIDKKTIKEEAKEIKNIIKELSLTFDKIINDTRTMPDDHRNDGQTIKNPNDKIPPVINPDYDNDFDFSGDIEDNTSDDNIGNEFDDGNNDVVDDFENYPSTDDNTGYEPDDNGNTDNPLDDFNPTGPDFSDNTPGNNNSDDFEVITGTIDNAGLDAGIVPDINQDFSDGTGFNSSYTQEQLDQIRDYVQDQLEQQYGDGYQVDVTVDSWGNASYHIMNDLDGSPVGDITGGSGLLDHDSKYDEFGYDKDGYDQDGFDQNGYDRDGYDQWGFDENGYDRDGYDEWGYDEDGYDQWGFDIDGYDHDGYDEWGFDEDGYNSDGFDMDGFDKDGYDEFGYDMAGYDRDGYDALGYDQDGFDRNGDMAYDGSNDDYLSHIPAFGTQGTPIIDKWGNIIGYQ